VEVFFTVYRCVRLSQGICPDEKGGGSHGFEEKRVTAGDEDKIKAATASAKGAQQGGSKKEYLGKKTE